MTNEEVARKAVANILKFAAAKLVLAVVLTKVTKGMKTP